MTYALGAKSLSRLTGVDPRLASVVKRAIEISSQDFTVVEGLRSKEAMWTNWGKGRSLAECEARGVPAQYACPHLDKVTWLNDPLGSKHATGHAVDLAPWVNGAIDWNDHLKFVTISNAMLAAANELKIHITWGGTWKSPDAPHFEI